MIEENEPTPVKRPRGHETQPRNQLALVMCAMFLGLSFFFGACATRRSSSGISKTTAEADNGSVVETTNLPAASEQIQGQSVEEAAAALARQSNEQSNELRILLPLNLEEKASQRLESKAVERGPASLEPRETKPEAQPLSAVETSAAANAPAPAAAPSIEISDVERKKPLRRNVRQLGS